MKNKQIKFEYRPVAFVYGALTAGAIGFFIYAYVTFIGV